MGFSRWVAIKAKVHYILYQTLLIVCHTGQTWRQDLSDEADSQQQRVNPYIQAEISQTKRGRQHTGRLKTHGGRRGDIVAERGAYILTRSPSLSVWSGSLFRGEKWQTQLLTETLVGKAMPRRGKREPPSLHLEIIHNFSKTRMEGVTLGSHN